MDEENFSVEAIKDLNVTIMGLGLNGGGEASAVFFAKNGAKVLVTDLKTEEQLKEVVERLSIYGNIRFKLGVHDIADFANADLVIKNPAVRNTSEYLKVAKNIETDISIFLRLVKNPIIAVTGSKGKSTTVSAIYHVLKNLGKEAYLGGNITVSPLSFIYDIKDENTPIILELSSWQLADVSAKKLLKPKIAVLTNILNDHQNAYSCFNDYVKDKAEVFINQDSSDYVIFNREDDFTSSLLEQARAKKFLVSTDCVDYIDEKFDGAYLKDNLGFAKIEGEEINLLPEKLAILGVHNRLNLLTAGLALYLFGISEEEIRTHLATFSGIAHRLEFLGTKNNISFYNDSAATMPDAALAATKSFEQNVYLICGGTDKELDFSPFKNLPENVAGIYLLKGSATDKLKITLAEAGIEYKEEFDVFANVFNKALADAELDKGQAVIVLSPGAASFGMFINEFDRGNQFKTLVKNYLEK